MQLTLGISPCPNDTFMFDALVHQRFSTNNITWNITIADVEALNIRALAGDLDVTKLSFATWLRVQETYALLPAGAALGHGCGPLVIARSVLAEEEILNGPVAIPGELTTANLLFGLRYPQAKHRTSMVFSDIENAVLSGRVVAGVIIHENRFTYAQKGLVKILDLGEYWEAETGLPIPLGAVAVKRAVGTATIEAVTDAVRQSVQFAMDQPLVSMHFVRHHAQEMADAVMQAHIRTYVNDYSRNLGDDGWAAVVELRRRATLAGLL